MAELEIYSNVCVCQAAVDFFFAKRTLKFTSFLIYVAIQDWKQNMFAHEFGEAHAKCVVKTD